MSDYMFMLENHLTAAQNRVLAEVKKAAVEANVNVFLTGGAVRDMLGGFPDPRPGLHGRRERAQAGQDGRGPARAPRSFLTTRIGRAAELVSPEGVTFEIAMARTRALSQKLPGSPRSPRPRFRKICSAAISRSTRSALSLNRASRGLLLDPTNGMGDLDGARSAMTGTMSSMTARCGCCGCGRFKARLGFHIAEKTAIAIRQRARSRAGNAYHPRGISARTAQSGE